MFFGFFFKLCAYLFICHLIYDSCLIKEINRAEVQAFCYYYYTFVSSGNSRKKSVRHFHIKEKRRKTRMEKIKHQFLPSMDSQMQRYKFVWRILMVANFGVAAYVFGMTKKKEGSSKSEKHEEAPLPAGTSASQVSSMEESKTAPATPIAEIVLPAGISAPTVSSMEEPEISPATPIAETVLPAGTSAPTINTVEESEIIPATPIAELVKVREPIAEDQQRELFQWMLDEKRKVKPMDRDEKKQIDEEKAMLKQFIRAKSTPSL